MADSQVEGFERRAMPIDSLEELRQHIELAISIELATIPPYLYSMYSIESSGSDTALMIRSVVVEEMLHAVLATNLLLAVGGTPDFRTSRYIPTYPMDLPHHTPPLSLDLKPISLEHVKDMFMRIEQPEIHNAPANPDEYETLGQFYHALEIALQRLSEHQDLFSHPQLGSQLADPRFYQPVAFDAVDSGGLVGITDLDSAMQAMEIIIHQGEGVSDERWADASHQELTHYHKLLQITDDPSSIGPVLSLPTNPDESDYPSDLRIVSNLFNAIYRGLYLTMDRIFTPAANQSMAVGVLYLLMADVLSQIARFLVTQELDNGLMAAPTFQVYEFGHVSPIEEVRELSARAAEIFPELLPVHDAVTSLTFIL
jgi:hypothetical protein